MRYISAHQLEKWLAKEVLGKDIKRKPPGKARRAKPDRNSLYRAWIRTLPSALSNRTPCEACHTGTDGGMSQKSSDYSCIPLTPAEHREYHQIGKPAFEHRHNLDCARLAGELRQAWLMARQGAA